MANLYFVFVIFGFTLQAECFTQYDNHTLIRLHPTAPEHEKAVALFDDPTGEVELLKGSRGINDTLDLLVPPSRLDFVKEYAKKEGLTLEVKQPHYGRTLEDVPEKDADRLPRRRLIRDFDVYSYNSHEAMQEYMETLHRAYPHLVRLQDLGRSYQGRKMRLCKISSQPNNLNPIIFIDAGIHGREWVAPAMAMYLIHHLVTDSTSTTKGGLLDGVDWYILPLVNPDGYEYTRSSRDNRMWRKTRSRNGNCYGVDGNRNYGFKWAVSGVSNDPCNRETFAGSQPFSEPETKMVRNIMMEKAKRIKLYVSLHSYGQYLVYPWGYTGDILPKEWKKLDNMAKAVSDSVKKVGGKPFKVLSAGKWYPAAGGSDDYAFGAAKIPYSYTMELTEGYEFNFPESLLVTVFPQFYEGFRTFGERIKREFGEDRLAKIR